jgi:hypothetical protein
VHEREVQSKLAGEEIHDRHGTEHQCLLQPPQLRQVGLCDCVLHAITLVCRLYCIITAAAASSVIEVRRPDCSFASDLCRPCKRRSGGK